MGPRLSCYVPQVVGDEGVEAGIAFGMAEKAAVVAGAVLRHPGKMLAEAAERSTMPLVCGRKGWVSRWAMARAAQTRSKAWSPEVCPGVLPSWRWRSGR